MRWKERVCFHNFASSLDAWPKSRQALSVLPRAQLPTGPSGSAPDRPGEWLSIGPRQLAGSTPDFCQELSLPDSPLRPLQKLFPEQTSVVHGFIVSGSVYCKCVLSASTGMASSSCVLCPGFPLSVIALNGAGTVLWLPCEQEGLQLSRSSCPEPTAFAAPDAEHSDGPEVTGPPHHSWVIMAPGSLLTIAGCVGKYLNPAEGHGGGGWRRT